MKKRSYLARYLSLLLATFTLAAADGGLPYRLLHVNLGVSRSFEGPSADAAQLSAVLEKFQRSLEVAQRHGYGYVVVAGMEDYVPDEGTAGERAARFRPYLEAAIAAAHARGLKLLLYGDEAIYRPEWLERASAKASVKDPRMWEMLAGKYRRLLRAFPQLDGIAVRIGEVIANRGFEALDLLHSAEGEPDPRVEERIRRYLVTAYRVVAGEFGKMLLLRTWSTSDWEVHSVP
ncbi:MAG: hypothetical protein ACPL88_06570, partial [Bryobacteraceae bacterium]